MIQVWYTENMRKYLFVLGAAVLFSFLPVSGAQAVDLDAFDTRSYDVEMKLSRDDTKRSIIEVTETIKVEFPTFDQNHGIRREVVVHYNGHSTGFRVISITDENEQPRNYSLEPGGVIQIGDADTFLHGEQTFVIKYAQRDVTRYYSNTKRDEFYWDVLGTEWRSPISQASISVEIDDDIAGSLLGSPACYTGESKVETTCRVDVDTENKNKYIVKATDLAPMEGVALAFGFQPKTFAVYEASFWEKFATAWKIAQFALIAPMVVLYMLLYRKHKNLKERKKELGTIVPEYLPPNGVSVLISANILSVAQEKFLTGQLIDLAVRHYIKLIESNPIKKGTLSTEYELEIIKDPNELSKEERGMLEDMAGGEVAVGQKIEMKKLKDNLRYLARVTSRKKNIDDSAKNDYGLYEKDESMKQYFKKWSIALAIIGVLCIFSVTILLIAVLVGILASPWRLSDKGLDLKRYLKGLEMYIGVAEVERLKMLQSPEGAAKVSSGGYDTNGPQIVKLYERVLPYAVLFNQEKEWTKQMGKYYETVGEQPDWYVGHSAFNAAVFSSAMTSFNSTVSVASSYSSSSGGSTGGGHSGGGGGGGGGGGW